MDWLVVTAGLIGFFLAGQKIWWAWWINVGTQVLWFWYGLATEQYAFIASSIVYSFVFVGNALKWSKEHFDEKKHAHRRRLQDRLEEEGFPKKGEVYIPGDNENKYLIAYEKIVHRIAKAADEIGAEYELSTHWVDEDLVVCWSWYDETIQLDNAETRNPKTPLLMIKADVTTNFLRLMEGNPVGASNKGRFAVPHDVAYWQEHAADYIRDYFNQMEQTTGAKFELSTWRDLDKHVTWVEWTSSVPIRGDLNPFKADELPLEERAEQSTVEKRGNSDHGPIFFSNEEVDADPNVVRKLYQQLQDRALELGTTVEMRMDAKPNGVLVH